MTDAIEEFYDEGTAIATVRRIAWVGTPRQYVVGEYGEREIDWEHENRREIVFDRGFAPCTIRVVGKSEGLSKQYVFGKTGKDSFIQDMSDEDALILLSSDIGENFKDVTHDDGFAERTYRPVSEFGTPVARP